MPVVTKAVFPVAGMGTRFLPATKANPKEMLPVVDKPLIQYAVEEAIEAGITDLIFINGRSKRAIPDHFDKAFELEAELEAKGKLVSYIHGGAKVGVIVDVVGGDEQLGKDLAMHIAASKPKSLDASGVSAELLDTERRVAIEKAREAGKPEAMLEKIAEGTVQKYLKDVTLLGQVFVKAADGKQTIEQLLKEKGASVAAFTLYMVGEGIEKKVDDFAAEVAAQAAAAAAKK